jgi:hypothetical protein
MTAALLTEPEEPAELAEPGEPDEVTLRLAEILGWLGGLAFANDAVDDATRIDRIALAEKLKAALERVQANEMVAFGRSQVAEQQRLDVDPRKVGRGIADQIGLACRTSPSEGSRRLHVARDLVLDMPHTFGLLARGEISGWTARLVTGETSHLDRPTRQQVDTDLAKAHLETKSPRAAAARAQRLAYAADPDGAADRCRNARTNRRVTLRPAPDTMSIMSGLLPVEQGVACLAALEAEAKRCRAAGDDRGRGQIMADTLVERVTGQAAAGEVAVEVQIVMPVDALLDPDDPTPSDVADFGPMPAPIVDDLLDQANSAASWWRRLFTKPTAGGRPVVVEIDPKRRRFLGTIADLINARDRHCRDPFCTAPIRHLDHIIRHTDSGPSTVGNGRGVCERGNHVREMPGWNVRLVDPETHTVITTTPTGHHYVSNPPEPP